MTAPMVETPAEGWLKDSRLDYFVATVVACLGGCFVRYTILPHLTPQAVESLVQLSSSIAILLTAITVTRWIPARRQPSTAGRQKLHGTSQTDQTSGGPASSSDLTEGREGPNAASDSSNGEGVVSDAAGGDIPEHFLAAAKGNRAAAAKRWQATLQWRREKGIDRLLLEPKHDLETIKKHYPHYLHGRGRKGELVMYELAGRMDAAKLKADGVSPQDMARHSAYMQEFMWRVLASHPGARMLTVMDMSGINAWRMTSSDTLDVIRATSEILNAHYPERVSCICVVNVPSLVSKLWSVIASVLPASMRERVHLASNTADLQQFIDPSHIPASYGGQDSKELGQSAEEMALMELITSVRDGKVPTALQGQGDGTASAGICTPSSAAPEPHSPAPLGDSAGGGGAQVSTRSQRKGFWSRGRKSLSLPEQQHDSLSGSISSSTSASHNPQGKARRWAALTSCFTPSPGSSRTRGSRGPSWSFSEGSPQPKPPQQPQQPPASSAREAKDRPHSTRA